MAFSMYNAEAVALLFLICFSKICTAQSQSCGTGWFGDRCQFQCHCAANTDCDPSNGACSGGCDPQWFGPACQYDVSEFTISGRLGSNPDWLTDNDDTTCNDENAQTITVRLATPHPLTWVRIVVSDTANLTEFQLGYQSSTTGVALCDNARSARVDDKTLDIFCPTSTIVTHVTVSGLGVSTLCSLFISGGRNVALKQATEQSSLYLNRTSEKAVDGTPSGPGIDFDQRLTCSHTSDNATAPKPGWWRVTFSNDVEINRLIIYNRIDCCEIRLENFTLQAYSSSGTNPVYSYTDPGGPAQPVYTVVPSPLIEGPVKRVRLDVSRNTDPLSIMTLCEVYAFGEVTCPAGKFGRQCERDCNCADQTEACFVSTGGCPSGCAAGYTGEDCYTQCDLGAYGEDCKETCSDHCAGGLMLCNKMNGTCGMGCEDRFYGPLCKSECPEGMYGSNCDKTCSAHCVGPSNACDWTDGSCDFGCDPGYQLPFCAEACPSGTYGINCLQRCSANCAGPEDSCDNVFGVCNIGCDPGYRTVRCDTKCDPGTYGEDCKETCSDHCAGEDKSCDHVTGTCDLGCEDRFYGPLCADECPGGRYGSSCDQNCSAHCAGPSRPCSLTDGSCDFGCDPGYLPPLCTNSCPRGKYGEGCNETCSVHCTGRDNQCDLRDGTCTLGCDQGFQPPKCITGEQSSGSDELLGTIPVVVIAAAAAAVVVAAVVLGVFLYRRRSVSSSHSASQSRDEERCAVRQLSLPPLPGTPLNSITDKTHQSGDHKMTQEDHKMTQGDQNQQPYNMLSHHGSREHFYEITGDQYEPQSSLYVGNCGPHEEPVSISAIPCSPDKQETTDDQNERPSDLVEDFYELYEEQVHSRVLPGSPDKQETTNDQNERPSDLVEDLYELYEEQVHSRVLPGSPDKQETTDDQNERPSDLVEQFYEPYEEPVHSRVLPGSPGETDQQKVIAEEEMHDGKAQNYQNVESVSTV